VALDIEDVRWTREGMVLNIRVSKTVTSSVLTAWNADDNSTRSFSASARSASQPVCATFNASLASSCASVHSALNAD
jgi:hypothetical protein